MNSFLNIISVRFNHIIMTCVCNSFLMLSHILLYKYVHYVHSVDGHLNYFQVGAVMNKSAMNIFMQVFLQKYVSTSYRHISKEWNCWF